VNVDGTAFQTVITGDGKTTVVLVSGVDNWAKVATGIEKEARVIRYKPAADRAGKADPMDVRTQARMLHDLLKALQFAQPSILVGHSFDGALIRIYADLYPEDVGGLILVDPFQETFVDWLKANQPKNYELFRKQAMEHYVSDWDDFLDRLRRARLPTGIPVVLLTAGRRQIRENNALEAQVKPADFEAGATAVMEAHKVWIAAVPNSRQVVVPDAGHEIPKEQPTFVIEAIKQTLNDIKERNR
jgi:pimeloyl-ACP methyl ester carboxylesterase